MWNNFNITSKIRLSKSSFLNGKDLGWILSEVTRFYCAEHNFWEKMILFGSSLNMLQLYLLSFLTNLVTRTSRFLNLSFHLLIKPNLVITILNFIFSYTSFIYIFTKINPINWSYYIPIVFVHKNSKNEGGIISLLFFDMAKLNFHCPRRHSNLITCYR